MSTILVHAKAPDVTSMGTCNSTANAVQSETANNVTLIWDFSLALHKVKTTGLVDVQHVYEI